MSDLPKLFAPECQTCKLRKPSWFCNLPNEALVELDRVKHARTFSPGDRLFEEGRPVQDLMIVCQGAATLTLSSASGKALMLGVSEPGEVLGLSAAISGRCHEWSAEALEGTRVIAINRSDFIRFMERFPPVALNAGKQLSRKVNRAYDKIRLIGAGLSVRQRLAAWLLYLLGHYSDRENLVTIKLTHEQIAQILAVSRESITRAVSDFRKRGVLDVRGIQFHIRDRGYLQSLLHIRK